MIKVNANKEMNNLFGDNSKINIYSKPTVGQVRMTVRMFGTSPVSIKLRDMNGKML
jgi:hypothetical protein